MAVLCRDHKLLFIQAPRTGSSAIGKVLREKLRGENLPPEAILDDRGMRMVSGQHGTLKQLLRHGFLIEDETKDLIIFSTVRNPYDSVVSAYTKNAKTLHAKLDDPDAWIHRSRKRVGSMDYARTHSFSMWVLWRYGRPALRNFTARRKGSMFAKFARGTNFLMRFETLQEDFSRVLREAGVKEKIEIPHYNVTAQRKRNYKEYYNPIARQIVFQRYRGDFEKYGYEF